MLYLGGEETVVYWTPLFIIVIDDHVHVHVYLDSVCCEYIIPILQEVYTKAEVVQLTPSLPG